MAIDIKKLGGSVLKSQQDFKTAAQYLAACYKNNPELVVVVSAPYGETNTLILQAQEYSSNKGTAYELLLQTGEQKSCALLGLALQELNIPFHIFCGHTIHLYKQKNGDFSIDKGIYQEALKNGIVIVGGFHVLNDENQLMNLGRGGSDFTAILLAHFLQPQTCELIKDVPGIFNVFEDFSLSNERFQQINFKDLLNLVNSDARIVQKEAVLFAMKKNILFYVKSLHGNGSFVGNFETKFYPTKQP